MSYMIFQPGVRKNVLPEDAGDARGPGMVGGGEGEGDAEGL